MVVPEEEEEEHDGDEVPALHYLVRLRIMEFQDWHTPPPSSDEDYGYNDDEDSDDTNYNGFHPGFGDGGGTGARPRKTRFAGPDEPRLGRGSRPTFRAREARQAVVVVDFCCPVISPRGAMPCRAAGSGFCATPRTRVDERMEATFDFEPMCLGSPSSIKLPAVDPMVDEAALCTPRQEVSDSDAPHSIGI